MQMAAGSGGPRPDGQRQSTLGLQRRIMLYVAVGCVAGLLFFGWVAHQGLDESTQIIFNERLHLAGLLAREVTAWVDVDAGGNLFVQAPERVDTSLALHATSPFSDTPAFRLSLLDQVGRVLASTAQVPERNIIEHQVLLHDLLAARRPGYLIHTPAQAPDRAHVVAFAPLSGLPGGILVEQGNDAALALPRALQRHLAWVGLAFIATGVLLAWLTTRQVAGPLTKLTAITRDIAAGNLTSPVPQGGQDEVQVLAASFETMRRQLQESHAQLAEANRELENRVLERTQELELRHADLARTSLLLEQREAERTFLLQKTIQAQEEERRRVARELHDAVGQLLSALVVRLSVLEGIAQSAAPALEQELGELRALTSHTVGEVRRLIVDLRPELLDDLGLAAALGWYAEQVLGKQGIAVALDVAPTDLRLPPQAEVAVFRVLQEAITNIGKHALARNVQIDLHWQGSDLVGTVLDDGQGFDVRGPGRAGGDSGVGLIGMRERVALLGGTLHIDSAPGRGTSLTFRVPLGKGAAA